jgi:hypothetical protein
VVARMVAQVTPLTHGVFLGQGYAPSKGMVRSGTSGRVLTGGEVCHQTRRVATGAVESWVSTYGGTEEARPRLLRPCVAMFTTSAPSPLPAMSMIRLPCCSRASRT